MSNAAIDLNRIETDFDSRLLTADEEARLFWRTRRQIAWSGLRALFATGRLRMSLVIALSVLFWIAVHEMLRQGFTYVAVHEQTTHAVFNVFFSALTVLLLFSTAVILYGSVYRSREVAFLLTTPARASRVFIHKFQEALWFASWGFLLLGSPMLVAYGRVVDAPWYYYVFILPYMLAFACIPGAIGAMLCLIVVHRLPTLRRHVLATTGVLLVLAAVWVAWSAATGPESELLTPKWLKEMSARLSFAEQRLLPSWWLSAGLLEAARHDVGSWEHQPWAQSIMFLVLLVSNALFFHQLALWTATRLLRPSFQRLQCEYVSRRRTRVAWLDRAAMKLTGLLLLPMPVRLLIVKDLRLFRRDPVQWSQFLIFFSLLSLYFLNIRRWSYDVRLTEWVNMVGFLNLSVVGLILSTFTTRFVFPMINLEGRRFWILGRLPLKRATILWGKFLFAAVGSIIPCASLIVLSDIMLPIDRPVMLIHLTACVMLCLGLSGIAVGLGARLLDLRQESPSKIATGFGGTMNLVLSAAFITAVVLCTAIPCHFYVAGKTPVTGWSILDRNIGIHGWMIAGVVATVLLGAVATIVPMRMGLRAFEKLEL